MRKLELTLNGSRIGPGNPPFIVAEMSGNHNGDLNRAYALMEAAKAAGVDAVKLQTYTADTITIEHDGPGFKIEEGLWKGKTLYELYSEAHTPWEWHADLFEKGRQLGMMVFSTPFDHTAVDFLERLDTPAYKIASFEIVDIPLIEKCASTGKPLIISTGTADFGEIKEAMDAAQKAGCRKIVLLYCISGYPAPAEDYNLKTIAHLSEAFGVPVGVSDHTLGIAVPVASVALGASMVEKHFTLSRADGGPDATFSLEPHELKTVAQSCRTAWQALGKISYERQPSELSNMIFRRSLYVTKDLEAGDRFTEANVRSIRPGFGLHPRYNCIILNKRALIPIKRGTPLSWDLVEGHKD